MIFIGFIVILIFIATAGSLDIQKEIVNELKDIKYLLIEKRENK